MTSLVPAHAHCPPQLLWARNHHPEKKETRNSVANRMTHASAIATNLKRPRFMLLSADSFVYTFRRLQRRCSLPRMREKKNILFSLRVRKVTRSERRSRAPSTRGRNKLPRHPDARDFDVVDAPAGLERQEGPSVVPPPARAFPTFDHASAAREPRACTRSPSTTEGRIVS